MYADKLPVILKSTRQLMIAASVYSMCYNNFCTQGRTSCLWKFNRELDSQKRTVNIQGFCYKASKRNWHKRAMYVLSQFLFGLYNFSNRLQDFNTFFSLRKFIILCFSICKENRKLNLEKSISQGIFGWYYLVFSIKGFY